MVWYGVLNKLSKFLPIEFFFDFLPRACLSCKGVGFIVIVWAACSAPPKVIWVYLFISSVVIVSAG